MRNPGSPVVVGTRRNHQRAFTLVEILVVLVVVAVLSGFAVLALRGSDYQSVVDTEIDRLLMLMTLAQEESLFRYRTHGVLFTQNGYAFFEYQADAQAWEPALDPVLRDRALSEGANLRLYIEGRPVILEEENDEEQRPQIVLFPDGTGTEFELTVEIPPNVKSPSLRGSVSGRIELDEDGNSG